jgi:hypothetical protein
MERQGMEEAYWFLMKTSLNYQDSADNNHDSVSANENIEPLFGDQAWIDERLQALRAQGSFPVLHLTIGLGG